MQRRQLLLSAATMAGGLVVHFSLPSQALAQTNNKSLRKEALQSWLALGADGRITVYSGKVDLGTGVKTALTQMVADELEVDFNSIQLVMGDTGSTIDQGQTAGSLSISVGGQQLRQACATARQTIAAKAAAHWGISPEEVRFSGDGRVLPGNNASQSASYATLLADGIHNIDVNPKAPLKKPTSHRYVGTSVPRVDIPAKVTGEFTYIHDFELPDMLHARVLRPAAIGSQLIAFDDTASRKVRGHVARNGPPSKRKRHSRPSGPHGKGCLRSRRCTRSGVHSRSSRPNRVRAVAVSIADSTKRANGSRPATNSRSIPTPPWAHLALWPGGKVSTWISGRPRKPPIRCSLKWP